MTPTIAQAIREFDVLNAAAPYPFSFDGARFLESCRYEYSIFWHAEHVADQADYARRMIAECADEYPLSAARWRLRLIAAEEELTRRQQWPAA